MSVDAVGIICGSGMNRLHGLEMIESQSVDTPFGAPSGSVIHARLGGGQGYFMARHGNDHTLAPHEVNYRANIWALKHIGIDRIVAVNTVGAINPRLAPGELLLPDQIVDYTWGRAQTFHEALNGPVAHIDFTEPYSESVRRILTRAAADAGVPLRAGGVYGATQGPRLETRSEINRMERDGCDVVGMTGMPEAALARELEIEYACCAVVVNMAAGRGDSERSIHSEIELHMDQGMGRVWSILAQLLNDL
ncbi:MAG: S-methyl-5'-thioinosine phosphorylase [Gammaproteobacteria bacterium]